MNTNQRTARGVAGAADWTCICSAAAVLAPATGGGTASFNFNSCAAAVVTPPPPTFVPPAGIQCLDSPLHTVMASELYAAVSSTSRRLQDRQQYSSTRLKGPEVIWTVKIVVSAGDSTVGKLIANFQVGQGFGSGPSARIVTLSKNKCDTS